MKYRNEAPKPPTPPEPGPVRYTWREWWVVHRPTRQKWLEDWRDAIAESPGAYALVFLGVAVLVLLTTVVIPNLLAREAECREKCWPARSEVSSGRCYCNSQWTAPPEEPAPDPEAEK